MNLLYISCLNSIPDLAKSWICLF